MIFTPYDSQLSTLGYVARRAYNQDVIADRECESSVWAEFDHSTVREQRGVGWIEHERETTYEGTCSFEQTDRVGVSAHD